MVEIRTVTDDELHAFHEAIGVGFGHRIAPEATEDHRAVVDLSRSFAAFDDDAVVGTTRSFATEVTVPGGAPVAAAAITAVTVMPTHRRRGVLTAMMRDQHDDLLRRGEPLAVLIPAEAPIYGRFGYGPATWRANLAIDRHRARFAGPAPDVPLRFVEPAEMLELAPPVYERFRATQPGALGRPEHVWRRRYGTFGAPREREEALARFHVVSHGPDGAPDGFATYELGGDWEGMRPARHVVLHELTAASATAYDALWRYLVDMDWSVRVEASERSVTEALPWLLVDRRQVRVLDVADFLWARVLDVPATLASRTYGATDRLVIEVVDGFLPEVGGRFALEASPEGASCAATSAAPDLTLDASQLGAAVLGGTPLGPALASGAVVEHRPGAVAAFDRLFVSAVAPWCHTWF
jgi:predicted acetyltransferase